MQDFFNQYKYLIIPFVLWFGIQTFKVLYEYFTEGKWNIKRFGLNVFHIHHLLSIGYFL